MRHRLLSFLIAACMWFTGIAANADTDGENRTLSFGLNGISDWSTQHPFLDLMKSARPWIGHLPDQWGGITFEELQAADVFDSHGWPVRVPVLATRLEAVILTDQPVEAVHLSGQYQVTFEGRGTIDITGRGRVISKSEGRIVFDYTPGPGLVGIAITHTDAGNPIRNIKVIKTDMIDLFEAGHRFNPIWIDRLGDVQTLRFMGWMATNDSTQSTRVELPDHEDFSYAWRGVPLPVMIELANSLDADPWFTLPHLADDAMVRYYAETTHATLEPGRVVYVEYSNEVWNFIFGQARWAQGKANEAWGDIGDGWMQYYGLRAAQVMDIWSDVFGADAETRLKRVVSVHTGWPELEQAILHGDKATEMLGKEPVEAFDAYAVTGYFGYELGNPETLAARLDAAQADAERAGRSSGLSRVALREYIADHRFDGVARTAADTVRNGSLKELTENLWPYHARVARESGLDLIMYEGGTHAAPVGEAIDDARLVAFLTEFNYSDEMGALYELALAAWLNVGGQSFNAFVDVAPPSRWGSWGALRHLNDDSPRWQALQRAR